MGTLFDQIFSDRHAVSFGPPLAPQLAHRRAPATLRGARDVDPRGDALRSGFVALANPNRGQYDRASAAYYVKQAYGNVPRRTVGRSVGRRGTRAYPTVVNRDSQTYPVQVLGTPGPAGGGAPGSTTAGAGEPPTVTPTQSEPVMMDSTPTRQLHEAVATPPPSYHRTPPQPAIQAPPETGGPLEPTRLFRPRPRIVAVPPAQPVVTAPPTPPMGRIEMPGGFPNMPPPAPEVQMTSPVQPLPAPPVVPQIQAPPETQIASVPPADTRTPFGWFDQPVQEPTFQVHPDLDLGTLPAVQQPPGWLEQTMNEFREGGGPAIREKPALDKPYAPTKRKTIGERIKSSAKKAGKQLKEAAVEKAKEVGKDLLEKGKAKAIDWGKDQLASMLGKRRERSNSTPGLSKPKAIEPAAKKVRAIEPARPNKRTRSESDVGGRTTGLSGVDTRRGSLTDAGRSALKQAIGTYNPVKRLDDQSDDFYRESVGKARTLKKSLPAADYAAWNRRQNAHQIGKTVVDKRKKR